MENNLLKKDKNNPNVIEITKEELPAMIKSLKKDKNGNGKQILTVIFAKEEKNE